MADRFLEAIRRKEGTIGLEICLRTTFSRFNCSFWTASAFAA